MARFRRPSTVFEKGKILLTCMLETKRKVGSIGCPSRDLNTNEFEALTFLSRSGLHAEQRNKHPMYEFAEIKTAVLSDTVSH